MRHPEGVHQPEGVPGSLVPVVRVEEHVNGLSRLHCGLKLRLPLFQFLSAVFPIEAISARTGELVPGLGVAAVKADDREPRVGYGIDWREAPRAQMKVVGPPVTPA